MYMLCVYVRGVCLFRMCVSVVCESMWFVYEYSLCVVCVFVSMNFCVWCCVWC